jgi:hypothetical protein
MRYVIIGMALLLCPVISAQAQISVGIRLPSIDIGINVPTYPRLVRVPGYPVYYDPQADSNYFFYDGQYWVYRDDNWYASSWYNGPWEAVGPEAVPLFVLRVPVRYYRQPPSYFRGWRADAAPRWDQHWGNDWARGRPGWDRWDRRSAPRPAPLPVYQRQYSGDRYPRAPEQQHQIHSQNYHYQPREAVVRQHYQPPGNPAGPRGDQHPQARDQHSQQNQPPRGGTPPGQAKRRDSAPRDDGRDNRSDAQGKGREKDGEDRGHDRH